MVTGMDPDEEIMKGGMGIEVCDTAHKKRCNGGIVWY